MKQVVSQLPWGHVVRLLQREKDPETLAWYARQAVAQGWSRSILELQMDRRAHERKGQALTNFPATLPNDMRRGGPPARFAHDVPPATPHGGIGQSPLPPSDSDMATQVFKAPYLFDFLGTADPRREREVEQALVEHIQHFLLEWGSVVADIATTAADLRRTSCPN